MALDFRVMGFGFGPVTGKQQVLVGPVDFGQPVLRADAAIKGFESQFDEGDHHVHAHTVVASIDRIENTKVFVKVTYLLRDSSGNIDDPYSGGVQVLVIADLATRLRPPIFVGVKRRASRRKATKKRRSARKRA